MTRPVIKRAPRVFLREHSRRAFHLKLGISLTFLFTILLESHLAGPIALTGNLLWLWVDFE